MLRNIFTIVKIALLLAACGGVSQPVTEITLEAGDFVYNVPSITVRAGEPVLLTIKNTGELEHDFVIEKINVETKVVQDGGSKEHHAHGLEANYDLHISTQVGQTSVIEFTAAEPGTYQFFCSVQGHREAGMLGELTVVAEK